MNRMCRTTKLIMFAVLFTLVATISFAAGCDNTTFSGSKTSNDHQFLVDFDVLNTTVDSKMVLSAGDRVETAIDIIKGDVDIFVRKENGKTIYQGNKVETCDFILEITESGTYTFNVTGANAKGSVYFVKAEKE